jgi:hypothetical protein
MVGLMQTLIIIDEDTPIEAYPGFLGWFWDNKLVAIDPELDCLKIFDWNKYFDSLEQLLPRTIRLNLSTGITEILISEDDHLAAILDQIPSVKVTLDIPENQGPGGGVGHVFFISENSEYVSTVNDIKILMHELRSDYALNITG